MKMRQMSTKASNVKRLMEDILVFPFLNSSQICQVLKIPVLS